MSAVVEARGLAVAYTGPPVLTGVTFAAAGGERVAVLGPNGGGKTTLFRAVLGELPPAAGELAVAGAVATVAQTERSRLDFPVTALDVAVMGTLAALPWWGRPGRSERTAAREALGRVGLADRADTTFGDLSGGQRQRVLIARALVAEPRLLLLDEPYNGLDAPGAERLDALLAELAGEGRAVLMATHDLDHARAAGLVLCLNRRQVAFGPPADTLTRAVLERTYGGEIVELPGDEGRAILPAHHHGHAH